MNISTEDFADETSGDDDREIVQWDHYRILRSQTLYVYVNNVKCQQCQTLVNYILVHMGLNCPTEVQTQFPIFFENAPLRHHCALCCSFGVMSLL